MTNKEKFKEVFGFTPDDKQGCLMPTSVCHEQENCDECVFHNWWYMEYKECFVIKEKYDEKM